MGLFGISGAICNCRDGSLPSQVPPNRNRGEPPDLVPPVRGFSLFTALTDEVANAERARRALFRARQRGAFLLVLGRQTYLSVGTSAVKIPTDIVVAP